MTHLTVNQRVLGSIPIAIGTRRGAKIEADENRLFLLYTLKFMTQQL